MGRGADVAADGFAEAEFLLVCGACGGLVEGLEGGFHFVCWGVGGGLVLILEGEVQVEGSIGVVDKGKSVRLMTRMSFSCFGKFLIGRFVAASLRGVRTWSGLATREFFRRASALLSLCAPQCCQYTFFRCLERSESMRRAN